MHGSMRRGLETEQTWPRSLGWRNRPGNRRNMKAPGPTASEPPRQPPTLQRISCDVAVFEMGEDEGGAGDAADFAGAGGDVLEGAPALAEQGEPAFAEAAQGALDGVAGAGVNIEVAAICGLFDGYVDAYSGAVVARVGQGGQSGGGGVVEGRQGVGAGGGQVMHRSGLGGRDPQREPAGSGERLDVAAVAVSFSGVPQVDDLAFDADGGSLHRSAGMILPSRITWENPASLARSRAWCRSGACSARTSVTSSTYR